MAYNFKAWLETKPDDEAYDFMNCQGKCAMGQWMASNGESWDISRYSRYVESIIGSPMPLSTSTTFGELKAKLRALELA